MHDIIRWRETNDVQEVEVKQALSHEGPPSVLPHMASPGDLLLQEVDSSRALSVLVTQPTYQVSIALS